jgi:hypothetical protein
VEGGVNMKHLWEVEHPYYCADSQWEWDFESWDAFLSEMIGADLDFNLMVRWDWRNSNDSDEELKADVLHLTYVRQRKGELVTYNVTVDKQDERRIMQFLFDRWQHLSKTWEGISDIPEVKEIE